MGKQFKPGDNVFAVRFNVGRDIHIKPGVVGDCAFMLCVKHNDHVCQGVSEDDLFHTEKEAEVRRDYLISLYNDGFTEIPFIRSEKLAQCKDDLLWVQGEILKDLGKEEGFRGIDFCDVSAGGIQVRLKHKDIGSHCVGGQVTILYDMSNIYEVPDKVVQEWRKAVEPERMKGFKRMLADGEKYGWD